MTNIDSGFGPGPAILGAEAILLFSPDTLNVLNNTIGWQGLGLSSICFSIDLLNRFSASDNRRGIFLIEKMTDKRIRSAAQMISNHLALDAETIAQYGSSFLRNSVLNPLSSSSKSIKVLIEEPLSGEENELLVGIAIVTLILIGIEVNVERYAGNEHATPQSIIDSYRNALPASYMATLNVS